MDYEKKYKEAIERAKTIDKREYRDIISTIFPELQESSEDEKIRKAIIKFIKVSKPEWESYSDYSSWIAWLDKQGNTNETVNRDEFAQGVLREAAINLITWIDYNAAEGNMCLSNMECKDIEDALVSSDWNKIYAYMKKKLEKQDKSATIDIDKMVNEYANNNECGNEEFGKPVNCMIRAYRQGINDALNLSSGIEKQGESKPADEVEPKDYNSIDPNFGKPIDKVEPKFHEGEWSEEDENNILFLTSIIEECFKDKEKITLCADTVCANFTKEDVIDRLESLKERVQPQNRWKPSEEQMRFLLKYAEQNNYDGTILTSLYKDLKKL